MNKECEVITFKADDIGTYTNCNNGVKIVSEDGKEFIIKNASVKVFERKGISYKAVEINL
ncbi:hypothetical protein D7X33_34870 [Butyricicoccus sp. 1XD8-22]|nr:hypothetical protein D7X33_34870 [Butyricicoccus sp. 1XD8-22]